MKADMRRQLVSSIKVVGIMITIIILIILIATRPDGPKFSHSDKGEGPGQQCLWSRTEKGYTLIECDRGTIDLKWDDHPFPMKVGNNPEGHLPRWYGVIIDTEKGKVIQPPYRLKCGEPETTIPTGSNPTPAPVSNTSDLICTAKRKLGIPCP
jgi:hypothetical protein